MVVRAGLVLLLRNVRDEWELLGGKLELGEGPARCAEREITEEVGWKVAAGPLLDAWQYHIAAVADKLVRPDANRVIRPHEPRGRGRALRSQFVRWDGRPGLPPHDIIIGAWRQRATAVRIAPGIGGPV